jgi:hypothetical protein
MTTPLLLKLGDAGNSKFWFTVERFFDFNRLWRIREVVQACDNTTYQVADVAGGRQIIAGVPQSFTDMCAYVREVAGPDDWVDVILADGRIIRNIQRGYL